MIPDRPFTLEELEESFPCWTCGKKVTIHTNKPILRVFCDDCRIEYEEGKEKVLKEYIRLKSIVMHERALRILEKQGAHLFKYKEASKVVLECASDDPEKFASSHEMIAAMELIRQRIKVKMQQKVLNHRVDMMIPDMHVILEIDGYFHQYHQRADNKRDIEIRAELGTEWEIVRIPTKHIETNVDALVDAIEGIYQLKSKIRKENNGILPSWYSAREKEHYSKILKDEVDEKENYGLD